MSQLSALGELFIEDPFQVPLPLGSRLWLLTTNCRCRYRLSIDCSEMGSEVPGQKPLSPSYSWGCDKWPGASFNNCPVYTLEGEGPEEEEGVDL